MKRILGLLLAGTMILALAACGKTDSSETISENENSVSDSTKVQTDSSNSADDAEANHTAQAEQTEGGSNMLVAYFLLQGNSMEWV